MDFEIIIQECFLGDRLQKLLEQFRYVEQNGRQAIIIPSHNKVVEGI